MAFSIWILNTKYTWGVKIFSKSLKSESLHESTNYRHKSMKHSKLENQKRNMSWYKNSIYKSNNAHLHMKIMREGVI